MRFKLEKNEELPGADILSTLQKVETRGAISKWTGEERTRLFEALREHGNDYKQVAEHVGTRDYSAVRAQAIQLWHKLQKNPDHPDVDILHNLHDKVPKRPKRLYIAKTWPEDEYKRLIEGIREHGRNWIKVTAHV